MYKLLIQPLAQNLSKLPKIISPKQILKIAKGAAEVFLFKYLSIAVIICVGNGNAHGRSHVYL